MERKKKSDQNAILLGLKIINYTTNLKYAKKKKKKMVETGIRLNQKVFKCVSISQG